MPTLIYAPGVRVVIATRREGIIDVSADLVRGNMTISENTVGQFTFSLTNQRRKYDGVFAPNDRISVQFKRLGPNFMQSFAGYLNNVPFLSLYPRTIDLEASCTLKRLQYQLWDSGSLESIQLLHQMPDDTNPESHADGGMRSRIISLVKDVGGWPEDNIHVGLLPADWFAALAPLEEEVATQLGVAVNGARDNLGGLAILAGLNPLQYGTQTAPTPTTGQEPLPPGAGTIPNPGKVTVNPALADNTVQMRWGYYILGITSTASQWIAPPDEEQKSIAWWAKQKILLVNPKNNRMIHCIPGAWGPEGEKKDFAIGLNAKTLAILQASEGDGLEVRLGSLDAALGEFNPVAVVPNGLLPALSSVVSDWSIPAGMTDPSGQDMAWHSAGNGNIPIDQLSEVVTPAGNKLKLHPVAASAYVAMRDEALKSGIRLNATDGYRSYAEEVDLNNRKPGAGKPGTSNHGWAMAMDMGEGCNTFTGAGYKWLEANAGRYGWVNPNWAKYGKGGPKVATPSAEQQAVMATILSVGQAIVNADSTLTPRGRLQVLLAAFETGWVESHMTNLKTGDKDSVGVFQQRPSQGWGTPAQITDASTGVAYAATKFFQRAVGSTFKNNKGTAGQLAQSVQSSALPTKYDAVRAQALAGLLALGVDASSVDGGGLPLTGPEPWHWEFWAGKKYTKTPYAALPKTAGGQDPNYKAPGTADGTNGMGFATDSKGQLVNINWWYATPDVESELLVGERVLMNDDPLLDFVGTVCQATMRSYMAAPNGDFISWFPDYFGHFGIAGRMSIEDIELSGDGFTMTWSDSHIVTHQFVMGALHSYTTGQYPGGAVEAIQKVTTSGIVSIDFPKVLGALLNITVADPRFKEWIDKDAIYKRYGARKDFQTINTIVGAQAEFWCACYLFMKKWAQQFSTRAFFTWMPEVYPGMILEFPSQKVQAYVTSVSHSFDFQGGGFQTSAVIIAPSAMDGSGLPLPKGGSDPGT